MSTRIKAAKLIAVPIAGLALISHHSFSESSGLDVAYEAAGYALLAVGAMGRAWCAAFIAGRKNAELVTEGPYSIVRNPLYFFSFLGFVGAGLAFESLTLACAFGLLFFLTHWPTILREEQKLIKLFGDSFVEYVRRVPRFVPAPWKMQQPATISISPVVFSRAVIESSLVLGVFLAADLIERVHLSHPSLVLMHLP